MIRWCSFLYLTGLFMVCLEVFIPGGVVGAIGVLSIGFSFWLAYTKIGAIFGSYFVSAGLLMAMFCIFLSVKLFPRTRFSKKLFLGANESDFKASSGELKSMEGKNGVTLTKLRPAGMARIEGRRVSVVAEGAFISQDENVSVLKVEGNRVVVRKTRKE